MSLTVASLRCHRGCIESISHPAAHGPIRSQPTKSIESPKSTHHEVAVELARHLVERRLVLCALGLVRLFTHDVHVCVYVRQPPTPNCTSSCQDHCTHARTSVLTCGLRKAPRNLFTTSATPLSPGRRAKASKDSVATGKSFLGVARAPLFVVVVVVGCFVLFGVGAESISQGSAVAAVTHSFISLGIHSFNAWHHSRWRVLLAGEGAVLGLECGARLLDVLAALVGAGRVHEEGDLAVALRVWGCEREGKGGR